MVHIYIYIYICRWKIQRTESNIQMCEILSRLQKKTVDGEVPNWSRAQTNQHQQINWTNVVYHLVFPNNWCLQLMNQHFKTESPDAPTTNTWFFRCWNRRVPIPPCGSLPICTLDAPHMLEVVGCRMRSSWWDDDVFFACLFPASWNP